MDVKKILLITNAFYPEISPRSFRASELAKELARQGHEVTVLTHPRDGAKSFCDDNNIQFKSLGMLTWFVPTLKGSGVVLLFYRIILRLSVLLFEYPNLQIVFLAKKALKNEKDYDALISIAVPYPIHWGVARVRTKKNPIANYWIADCGDPYMGQENDTFKPPFYFGWVEKWFSRKADFLTVPTNDSIKGYYPEFHPKIKVIPQGFRFEDVKLYEGKLSNNKVIFGYAGMFIPGRRDPSEFLQFLNSVDNSISFEFHIYTPTPKFVEPFVLESKGRIILKEILPRENLLYELSKMNFMVNFENVGSTQTPSKLIDYLIIDKPVLSVAFGNLKKEELLNFLKGNYDCKMELPNKENYRIERVAKQFISLMS